MEQVCSKCKILLSIENFVKDKSKKTGHRPSCNSALGLFKDNIQSLKKAIEYLEKEN